VTAETSALLVEVGPRLEQASSLLARALLGEVNPAEAMAGAVLLIDSAMRHVCVEEQRREILGLAS
jgi:hypothetical protein